MPLAIAAGGNCDCCSDRVIHDGTWKGPATVTPSLGTRGPICGKPSDHERGDERVGNLAGGKVTYIDGHITNCGNKTVTGISVQVLFRNAANEVAQNETQAMKWIRTRDPYIDLEPVSAAPLKPGEGRDFRLIFDAGDCRTGTGSTLRCASST